MRILIPVLLVLAFACNPGTTQTETYTAYTIDTLHGVFGHWNPFGVLSTGNADECREQVIYPAAYLPPTSGNIIALEVSPHVTGTVPYKSLTISMGHTTVSSLTFSFATNLPVPVVVYTISNQSINWSSRSAWQRITFQAPFWYDGKSNLVIEFQKVVDRPSNPALGTISHQYNNRPMRKDLPWPVWADGSYGSGASTASTATYRYNAGPFLTRLIFPGQRTLTIDSSKISGKNYFYLGGTAILTVQAPPGEVFLDGIDFGLRSSGLQIPGVQGTWWLPALFNAFWMGVVDSQGKGICTLPIPNIPSLVGTHVYFQSATAGTTVGFTNVVDAIVAQ